MLIYKIIPRAEWEKTGDAYAGSGDDRRDGFIHLSTAAQLAETFRRHFAGQSDLLLLAVTVEALGPALKWELAPRRGADFPHLYAPLPKSAVAWARPITKDTMPL